MFDVAGSLMNALSGAREGLGDAAQATARVQTPFGNARSDAPMAQLARQTLFTEALLAAVHSRLAEIKSVTHG